MLSVKGNLIIAT